MKTVGGLSHAWKVVIWYICQRQSQGHDCSLYLSTFNVIEVPEQVFDHLIMLYIEFISSVPRYVFKIWSNHILRTRLANTHSWFHSQELVVATFGPHMAIITSMTILVFLVGSLISYFIITGMCHSPSRISCVRTQVEFEIRCEITWFEGLLLYTFWR